MRREHGTKVWDLIEEETKQRLLKFYPRLRFIGRRSSRKRVLRPCLATG